MKTRTGGHSVQFTDIESLKHRSGGMTTTTAPSGTDTDVSPSRRGYVQFDSFHFVHAHFLHVL